MVGMEHNRILNIMVVLSKKHIRQGILLSAELDVLGYMYMCLFNTLIIEKHHSS